MKTLFSKLPFLAKLDHYLLVNHPILWRTRGLYFFLFVLIGGHALAYVLPIGLVATGLGFTINATGVTMLLLNVIVGFILLFWGYFLMRHLLKSPKGKQMVSTFLVYVFSIGALFSSISLFQYRMVAESVRQTDQLQLMSDMDFLSEYDYLRNVTLQAPGSDQASSFENEYRYLDLAFTVRAYDVLDRYGMNSAVTGDYFIDYYESRDLRNRVSYLDKAERFIGDWPAYLHMDHRGGSLKEIFNFQMFGFWLALFLLPSMLMIVSISGLNSFLLASFFGFLWFVGTGFCIALSGDDDTFVGIMFLSTVVLWIAAFSFPRRPKIGFRVHEMLIVFAPAAAFAVSFFGFIDERIEGIMFPGFLMSSGISLLLIHLYLQRKRRPQKA